MLKIFVFNYMFLNVRRHSNMTIFMFNYNKFILKNIFLFRLKIHENKKNFELFVRMKFYLTEQSG